MAGEILAAGIAAAAGLAGTGGQMVAMGKMNRKTRSWNEKMMHRQRDWALADYAMQNEYNSPAAQMARLKAAGLNPHLVYGNGADAQGGTVRSVDTPSWKPEMADIQGGVQNAANSALFQYQNVQQRQLQNDLLKTQTTALEREIQLKEIAATANTLGIIMKNFKFAQDQKMAPYNLQLLKENISKTQQDQLESLSRISNTTWQGNRDSLRLENENKRLQSDLDSQELQRVIMRISANKGTEEINQLKQNIQNLKQTGEYQQMENEIFRRMKEANISPRDPAYYKLIAAFAEKLGQSRK